MQQTIFFYDYLSLVRLLTFSTAKKTLRFRVMFIKHEKIWSYLSKLALLLIFLRFSSYEVIAEGNLAA